MKKIIKSKLLLVFALSAIVLVSCDEKATWSPGQPALPNNQGVYFDKSNGAIGDVELDEDYLNVAVSRLNTSAALTVPVKVIWASEGLIFPDQSVSFAAGEETAYFRVGFNKEIIEFETPYPFELSLDPQQTDPYDEFMPGTANFIGKFNRVEPWVFIADMNCTFEALSGSKPAAFDPFTQKLYKKIRTGRYKIENWCLNNTGEWYGDLLFTVDKENTIIVDESIGYHGAAGRWYFYLPWADSDSSSWQINGHLPTSTGVYMTYFYLYVKGSTDSAYAMDFDEDAKTAKVGGYSRYSKSTFSSGRFQITYNW